MTTPSSICNLNEDILTLICSAIYRQSVQGRPFDRPSVLAFSATCKLLRVVAAPIIFNTLVLWDWDSFCETVRMMRACSHVRRSTRTLHVTPIVERPLPPSNEKYGTAGLRATRFDASLPKAGSRVHTNSQLHYGTPTPGVIQPKTAYMPLANIDNGPNICVKEHAVALVDLLLSFENLTGLVFGLGQDPSARPLFEDSLISALRVGKLETSVFSTVTRLDIEDTALFWTAVCPSVQDLTLRLGYSSDGAKLDLWPVVESIRSLRVSGTAHCAQSSQVRYGWFGIERRGHACGSALTKAPPNATSLDLLDCAGDLEALLDSLKEFAHVQHLHIHADLMGLGVGFELPSSLSHCNMTGTPPPAMNDEERAAELVRSRLEAEARSQAEKQRHNDRTQAALNVVKRIALNKFPRLQGLKVGNKIAYDLTQLQSRTDLGELDTLPMVFDVPLNEIR